MMNVRIGSTLVGVALTISASAAWACDRHADAAEAKDSKAVAAGGEAKGCNMPCCAKAKTTAVAENPKPAHDTKETSEKVALATKPSKGKPAQDAPSPAPSAEAGTHR